MNPAQACRDFWSARAPREQRMLGIGLALLSLLLIWLLLIEPAIDGRSRWQQSLPGLRSQLAETRAIGSEIAALPARATPAAPAADVSRASLERSLKDQGLDVQSLTVSDSGVSAALKNVAFAALAEWLQQTQSSARLVVTEASITTRDVPGRVDARLSLQRTP